MLVQYIFSATRVQFVGQHSIEIVFYALNNAYGNACVSLGQRSLYAPGAEFDL